MKISTTKIRQIIKEELQRVLSEGEDDDGWGDTVYADRAGPKLAGKRGKFVGTGDSYDPDETEEVDVAAAIKREQESPAAPTFREEAQRLFNIFFADYDDDALEIMIHNDPELEEILAKLYGWNLDLFPHDVQPSPTIVKIAQAFEKEKKVIVDNETEFLDRVEADLYQSGLAAFAQSKSNPPDAATKVKKGQAAIPGTKQHSQLQDLFKIAKPRPPRS
jgi:sulfite reductase alpha subunit-like flavoprotein|tara:strand:+ start:1598 stop:2254 length:657 start_codon:yes stop_codon:yes gene_type:complete